MPSCSGHAGDDISKAIYYSGSGSAPPVAGCVRAHTSRGSAQPSFAASAAYSISCQAPGCPAALDFFMKVRTIPSHFGWLANGGLYSRSIWVPARDTVRRKVRPTNEDREASAVDSWLCLIRYATHSKQASLEGAEEGSAAPIALPLLASLPKLLSSLPPTPREKHRIWPSRRLPPSSTHGRTDQPDI